MTSKIKIKMGEIEIEYEGSEDFLKEELPELLSAVSDLYKKSAPSPNGDNDSGFAGSTDIQGTTANIAAKLGGSTGPDLAMASAVRLTLVLGKEKFQRKELLEEMQTATAYYKTSYSSNLTTTLNKLVKNDKLMEPAKDTYSLSASSRNNIGSQLA